MPSAASTTPSVQSVTPDLDPAVVCDGLWHRQILNVQVTDMYNVNERTFHGEPNYVFYRQDKKSGTMTKYRGTFRSVNCVKVAVKPGTHTPNGTSQCNYCARLVLDTSFQAHIISTSKSHTFSKFTRNDVLTFDEAISKLKRQSNEIKLLRQHRSTTQN